MKKLFAVLLTIMLLVECFTACNSQLMKEDAVATPTAIRPINEREKDLLSESDQQQESNQQQIDENQETFGNKELQEDAQAVQPETNKESQKQDEPVASKVEESIPEEKTEIEWTVEEIHGDEPADNPVFVSEEAWIEWLTKGSGAYIDERESVLQQADNKPFNYVHFETSKISNILMLKWIVLSNASKLTYEYAFTDQQGTLKFTTNRGDKDHLPGPYKLLLEGDTKPFCSKTIGGAQYTVYRLRQGKYLAYLLKDDIYHSINIENYFGDVEALLSQLVVQQVTVNLNSDLVTE